MKSDPHAKSMRRLERVKGIEPSYSAWKSGNLVMFFGGRSDIFAILVPWRSLQNFVLSER
jgi:hypothetical protein